MQSPVLPHPKGCKANILLSSVFGPFAQDDQYGSRTINPMELYQNQVTRVQGVFSLRMFHRSFGLLLLQANIDAPCTVLDFPSQQRFIQELQTRRYDIIGISAIIPNIGKAERMCALIRKHQPQATIVVGGHIANKENIETILAADHVVRGDGVRWFRQFLGQPIDAPVRHPMVDSAFGARILGIKLREKPGDTAAILIPSVGCPMGCNFCSTSALFGGKGKFVNFYETGDELFALMQQQETELKTQSFFILDENFLLHRKRALRLLELMQAHDKSWMLNVFSSARVLLSYKIEQLVGLGIGWVWMGIEGKQSQYRKLRDVDTRQLVRQLHAHGICVLGSSIIGLDEHTPENIDAVIAHAASHQTDFHQFMLYTPIPGTPLYAHRKKAGELLPESKCPPADAHGQGRFNFRHQHITNGQETQFLLQAFEIDFKQNGPSLARLIQTLLTGWQHYKHHPERRIRQRYARQVAPLKTTYAGAVWAMREYYRSDAVMHRRMDRLLGRIYREFGAKTRLAAPLIGRYARRCIQREEHALANGRQYEPCTFYEKNKAAAALDHATAASSVQPASIAGRRLVAAVK